MSVGQDSAKNEAGQVVCPFCQATDNELFSLFGQTLLGSQYYCRHCRTVFEAVRWQAVDQDTSVTAAADGAADD